MNMRKSIISILAVVVMLVVISTCACSCGCGNSGNADAIGMLSYFDYGGGVSHVEIVSWYREGDCIEVTTVNGDKIFTSCFSLKLY